MKLVRYGRPGKEKPGLIDGDGKLRDLSGRIDDITPEQLSDKALAKLARINPDRLPLVRGKPRFGPPLTGIGNFVCVGLNYTDHAEETGRAIPTEPVIFSKHTSCIAGAYDDVVLPKKSVKPIGKWRSGLSSVRAPGVFRSRRRWTMSPVTSCAMTYPSARTRSSMAASG